MITLKSILKKACRSGGRGGPTSIRTPNMAGKVVPIGTAGSVQDFPNSKAYMPGPGMMPINPQPGVQTPQITKPIGGMDGTRNPIFPKPNTNPYNPIIDHKKLPINQPRPWGVSLPGRSYPAVEGPGNPSWEARNPQYQQPQGKNYQSQTKLY